MKELNRIVNIEYTQTNYGKVELKLKEYLDKNGISRNYLATCTGIEYPTIDRYYKNQLIRIDLTLIAKMCFALDCDISGLLYYHK